MVYRKKCPKCEINFITEDEEICSVCNSPYIFANRISVCKFIENDFSRILRGRVYGGNSRKIYEKFCETLNWDKEKANQFGWQTPLYAMNADTDRNLDVWFIFHANYDTKNLNSVVDESHVINLIVDDGDRIIEVVDDSIGISNAKGRIVFVKNNSGYEFAGVYNIIQNGTTRIYKRYSDNYPVK